MYLYKDNCTKIENETNYSYYFSNNYLKETSIRNNWNNVEVYNIERSTSNNNLELTILSI